MVQSSRVVAMARAMVSILRTAQRYGHSCADVAKGDKAPKSAHILDGGGSRHTRARMHAWSAHSAELCSSPARKRLFSATRLYELIG